VVATSALTRRFGAFTAVDSVSFAVQAGEIFGLIGPNGAGKTTLLKMLTTMLPPSSGQALVAGYDIAR
jgi:ABC-2 type transport system ATP-binding protein